MAKMIMLIFALKWSTVDPNADVVDVDVEMTKDERRHERREGEEERAETALEGWRFWIKSDWTELIAQFIYCFMLLLQFTC